MVADPIKPTPRFYDRSEDERIAMTERAMAKGEAVLERWAVLTEDEAKSWSGRAALAAQWLADQESIVDMGCGTMMLEQHLRPDQVYIPVDIVARDARTLVCDFNRQPPPQTSAQAVACLGLLEYLYRPLDLLRALAAAYRTGVVSYCVYDTPKPIEGRRANAWVNDLTTSEVEALLAEAGWTIVDSKMLGSVQRLWRLTSAPPR